MKLQKIKPGLKSRDVTLIGKIAKEHQPYTKSFNPEVLGCMADGCTWESLPTETAHYQHVLDIFMNIKNSG